jgi:hypothetical protein
MDSLVITTRAATTTLEVMIPSIEGDRMLMENERD